MAPDLLRITSNEAFRDADFEEQVQKYTLKTSKAACGRDYIRISALTAWLRSDYTTSDGKTISQFHRILLNVYEDKQFWMVLDEKVDKKMDIVFCILLSIGQPHAVKDFQAAGIVDKKLPMRLATLDSKIRGHRINGRYQLSQSERTWLAKQFDNRQWKFRPHVFKIDDDECLSPNCILPIYNKEPIVNDEQKTKQGGTARVYRLKILEEFLDFEIRKAIDKRCSWNHEKYGKIYILVVKEYIEDSEDHRAYQIWRNEKDIFKAFQHSEVKGVVKYLGCFIKLEKSEGTRGKLHVLLELGKYDLSDFFRNAKRLTLPAQFKDFWQNLFRLVDALKELHELPVMAEDTVYTSYALHADIKPANILNFQGQWKFADLGFARILSHGNRDELTPIFGYTRAWGAPECHPGRSQADPVNTKIDIWSLGCVFSVAATWLILGDDGVKLFDQVRIDATRRLKKQAGRLPPKQTVGTFFHDGTQVLDEVLQWHKYLRSSLYKHDYITQDVLDLIEKSMLVGNRDNRADAKSLHKQLTSITDKWQTTIEQGPDLSETIMATIQKYNQESSAHARFDGKSDPASWNKLEDPEAERRAMIRKDQADQFSSTVSYVDPDRKRTIDGIIHETSTAEEQHRAQISEPEDGALLKDPPPILASEYIWSPSPRGPKRAHRQRPSSPENAFQARAKMRKEKMSAAKHIKGVLPGYGAKDKKLVADYVNRDIMFLIDNSWTMNEHWDEARDLLEVLLYKCRKIDEDGLDVMFTSSDLDKPLNSDRDNVLSAIDSGKFDPDRKKSGRINIYHTLDIIFKDFMEAKPQALGNFKKILFGVFKKWPKEVERTKAATLVFLTDGIWKGLDRAVIEQTIKSFLQELSAKHGNLYERPFTIQFIHFGEDKIATQHLDQMDDNLCSDGLLDVIDTEPARGDIYKMLLGSLKPDYDDLDLGYVDTAETCNGGHANGNGESSITKPTVLDSINHENSTQPANRGIFGRNPSTKAGVKTERRSSSRVSPTLKKDLSRISEDVSTSQATAGAGVLQSTPRISTAHKIPVIMSDDMATGAGATR